MQTFVSLFFLSLCVAGEPSQVPTDRRASSAPRFLSAHNLETLPHVHSVIVTPAKNKRKRQIIHILDWHFVPPAHFEADIRAAEGKPPLTNRERLLAEPDLEIFHSNSGIENIFAMKDSAF